MYVRHSQVLGIISHLSSDGEVEVALALVVIQGLSEDEDGLGLGLALEGEPPLVVSGHDRVLDLRVGRAGLVPVLRRDASVNGKA